MLYHRFGCHIRRLTILYLRRELWPRVASVCVLRIFLCFYPVITHSFKLSFCIISVRFDSLINFGVILHVNIASRKRNKIFDLLLNTHKRFSFCYIIDCNASVGVPYVTIWYRSKPFLTSCIPKLKFYYFCVVNFDILQLEVYSNCAILSWSKSPLTEPNEKRGLTGISVSNQNDFIKSCDLSRLNFLWLQPNPLPYILLSLLSRVNQISKSFTKVWVVRASSFIAFLKFTLIELYCPILRVRPSSFHRCIYIHG